MKRYLALRAALAALSRPIGSTSIDDTIATIRHLRGLAAEIAEEMIELLDRIDGDPDLELEEEAGIEDAPHDDADEGNEEPSLAFSGELVPIASGALSDGELDLSAEEEIGLAETG